MSNHQVVWKKLNLGSILFQRAREDAQSGSTLTNQPEKLRLDIFTWDLFDELVLV